MITEGGWRFRGRAVLAAAAGPVLIVAAVLTVLHGFAVGGRLSNQHPDLLGFWMPEFCSLGRALAAAHVPAWNPFAFAGAPLAADPQSGWAYLPAMALFGGLSCGTALRAMVVLQPMLAGLGLYAFLRGEGISRPGSTVGGLGLAMVLADSRLGVFLPFPSAVAWTAVLLALTSAFLRASTPRARLLWMTAAAVAWTQLAAAYFAHGVVLGTSAVVVYVVAKAVQRRGDGEGVARTLLLGAGLGAASLAVGLAYLVPRLAYAAHSSYGLALSGPAQLGPRLAATWPLKLGLAPGGDLGVLSLLFVAAAWRARRHRALVVGFSAFGAAAYLVGLTGLIGPAARLAAGHPALGLLSHYPQRLALGLVLALAVLAGIGFEAWWSEPPRRRALLVAPGVAVWLVLPAALGAGSRLLVPLAAVVSGALLVVAGARSGWAPRGVAALLALEVVAAGLLGQGGGALGGDRAYADDLFGTRSAGWWVPLESPAVSAAAYLRAGAMVAGLRTITGRYVSFDPRDADPRGYLALQTPADRPLMANGRGMLFGLPDAQGYGPVQLRRYWEYVRVSGGPGITYNAAFFRALTPATLDLLRIGGAIARRGPPPVPGWTEVVSEGRWVLFRNPAPAPAASVLSSWRVVGGPAASLAAVAAPGFDPGREAILEIDPGIVAAPVGAAHATVRYAEHGPQAADIDVRTGGPAVVVIRTPFDPNWRATVDGRPARLLAADHLLQAVAVPAGAHRIELRYQDRSIAAGLAGSVLALVGLLGAALLAGRRARPRGLPAAAGRGGPR